MLVVLTCPFTRKILPAMLVLILTIRCSMCIHHCSSKRSDAAHLLHCESSFHLPGHPKAWPFCRNNCLSGLPELPATSLKSLNLSHNRLTTLFQISQPRLLKLHHLNCSHNSLSRLSLSCVPELRKLVASHNQLGCLDSFSAMSPHLQFLDLAGNKILDLNFVQVRISCSHHTGIAGKKPFPIG